MNKIHRILPQEKSFLQILATIDKPVKYLWYTGSIPDPAPTVAIVGSRKPTSYGRAINNQLTSELAKNGVVIVSGLAIGHDGLAHQACLEVGGKTVAVIGNGLDNVYPRTNQGLAEKIVQAGGAIISEYPPEAAVYPNRFLERNRLISGLADITVIIEAGERSGTLNTASHALAQGREVMAVPGNITSPLSRGCNRLIAQGASPVLEAQDILDQLGLARSSKRIAQKIRFDSPDAQKIYDLILAGYDDGDQLLELAQLEPSHFSIAMTMLELNGYIQPLGANRWSVR